MRKNRIIFLGILFYMIVLSILYPKIQLMYVVCAMFGIVIVEILFSYLVKNSVMIKIQTNAEKCLVNKTILIQLTIGNASWLSAILMKGKIHIKNGHLSVEEIIEVSYLLEDNAENVFEHELKSKHTGFLQVWFEELYIYDYLRIIRWRVPIKDIISIQVLPNFEQYSQNQDQYKFLDTSSEVRYSNHLSGEDPSEIYALRDYKPGDTLNRIHWKLTSKKRSLVVKEYGRVQKELCNIYCDFYIPDVNYTLDYLDSYTEVIISLGNELLDQEKQFVFTWFDQFTMEESKKCISTENDFEDLIECILTIQGEESNNLYQLSEEVSLQNESTTFLYITANLNSNRINSLVSMVGAEHFTVILINKDDTKDEAILHNHNESIDLRIYSMNIQDHNSEKEIS